MVPKAHDPTLSFPKQGDLDSNEPHHKKKQAFCICENKDADQLCGNSEADQRLCFRYIASRIPLLPLYPSSVIAQPGLCHGAKTSCVEIDQNATQHFPFCLKLLYFTRNFN